MSFKTVELAPKKCKCSTEEQPAARRNYFANASLSRDKPIRKSLSHQFATNNAEYDEL